MSKRKGYFRKFHKELLNHSHNESLTRLTDYDNIFLDKRMHLRNWYHGTEYKNITKLMTGVRTDVNKETELDFGYGFYLTTSLEEAIKFIVEWKKATETLVDGPPAELTEHPVVIEYELPMSLKEIKDSGDYKVKDFDSNGSDSEFFDFVFFNRTKNAYGDQQHDFDFVYGKMSNSNPIDLIAKYNLEILTEEEVKLKIGIFEGFKQLSIHNQTFCDKLKLIKVFDASTGKELPLP